MAQTVGQHGLAAFTNPSNGDALDATVVKANDNSTRDAYVDHDSDGGIHVQSSLLSARPVAGTAGRKWLTTDTGSIKLWFDTGSAWEEIAYLPLAGGTIAGNASITGTLGVTGVITATGGVTGALTGNATTATTLQTARLINGVSFNGSADITITAVANASTLTGTTLNSPIVASSLTSVGTLSSLTVGGQITMANNTLSQPIIKDYGETKTAPTISTGTLTLNLANGNVFVVPLNANITTLTISNPKASGTACSFTLVLTADGTARTVTWGTAVKWPAGTAPTLTSTNTKNDTFVFTTWDGGTTWYAFVAGQNS